MDIILSVIALILDINIKKKKMKNISVSILKFVKEEN